MTSGSADESADRALSSVARKLDKSLSIESTVNELIAEATDPTNLGTIFIGMLLSLDLLDVSRLKLLLGWSPHM